MSDESNILLSEKSKEALNEVADHYNKKNETDLASRSKSRIFFLRNFNNWIKSVLLNKYINELPTSRPSVLDLGCGRGGDIRKWKIANVSRVTFADIAEKSLEECEKRYHENRASFKAKFVHLDATKELLADKIDSENERQHELVSSQFVIHYSFESFEQADTFLRNVSDSLKVGGFFVGTTTNAYELIKRLRQSSTNSFGNEIYR